MPDLHIEVLAATRPTTSRARKFAQGEDVEPAEPAVVHRLPGAPPRKIDERRQSRIVVLPGLPPRQLAERDD